MTAGAVAFAPDALSRPSGGRLRRRRASALPGAAFRLPALAVPVALAASLATAAPAGAEEEVQVRPGKPTIIGGSTSTAGAWPWAVLVNERDGSGGVGTCTGSLIGSRWVLTAAHCLSQDEDNGYVEIGNINRGSGHRVEFNSTHRHPGFDPMSLSNDIALIYLEGTAPLPIPLVDLVRNDAQHDRIAGAGASTTVLGWGFTTPGGPGASVLQEGVVLIADRSQCRSYDETTRLCAAPAGTPQICFGDSGGPMVADDGGTWYQVGITTSSTSDCGGPSLHVKVAAYTSWIAATREAEVWIDSPSAAEGATGTPGTLAFTVSLTATSPGDVVVDWEVTGGTASSGTDYQAAATGTATIAAGATSATIDVTLVGDGAIEPHETVEITLQDSSGARIRAASSTGTGTIENDDFPVASIDSPSVTEGASGTTALPFTVSLSAPSFGEVTADWAVTGGTAASGTDYGTPGPPTGTVAIPAGATTTTIRRIVVYGDDRVEPDETVEITLSNPTGVTFPGGAATLAGAGTILNDDLPVFTVDSPRVVEGDGGDDPFLVFALSLDQPNTRTVAVSWSVTGGTATRGTDYGVSGGGVLQLSPGATGTRITAIQVRSDDRVEFDETVVVTLSGPVNATFAGGATTTVATGTILNDDTPELFVDAPAQAPEGDAGATSSLTFTVSQSATSPGDVTVAYGLTGSATAGTDYRAAVTGTVTIPAGATSAPVEVTVIGDAVVEPDETVEITLSAPTGALLRAGGETATGTILNDDVLPFSLDSPSVAEGATGTRPTLRFTVRPLGPLSVAELTWTTTAGGTATAGADFEAASGTITFATDDPENAPVDLSATFDVTVIGDGIHESDEVVEVEVLAAGTTTPVAGRGTIRNDEPLPRITFDSPSVEEGDSGTANLLFTATMDPVSDRPVEVEYETTDVGTATPGTDFDSFDSVAEGEPLTFDPGDRTARLVVIVNGDGEVEDDETVALHILEVIGEARLATSTFVQAPPGATLATGTGLLVTGTIIDDEPRVSVSADPRSVPEGATGAETTVDLRFTMTRTHESAVTVTWDLARNHPRTTAQANNPDTGFRPDDDIRWAGGDVDIPAGSTGATVPLTVRGDDTREEDETAVFHITDVSAGVGIGTASSVTVTILDDEFPMVSIDSPTVNEGDSGATELAFEVALDVATGVPVTVDWDVVAASSTADAGDYTLPSGRTLTFGPGATSTTITVTVNGDRAVERDETVVIELSNVRGGDARLGTPRRGTGTIRNDDFPEFTVATSSVAEGARNESTDLAFTASLSRPSYEEITVGYAVTGGTATAGADYVAPAAGTLTFPPGGGPLTVPIEVTGDTNVEPDETVTLTFSNLRGGAARFPDMATTLEATGTIVNDDIPRFSVAGPPTPVDEGSSTSSPAATLAFTVSLDPAANEEATVDWAVAGGTAASGTEAAGADYEGSAYRGTLTFAAGGGEQTIRFTIHGDDESEPDETVVIELSNPRGGGAAIGTGRATGTIGNDDSITLSVTAPADIDEGDAGTQTLDFTVGLSATATEAVAVGWVASGTAASVDFTRYSEEGRLVFAPGDLSKTLFFTVRGNTVAEPDGTLTVLLRNARGPAVASGKVTLDETPATVTIRNDDFPKLTVDSPPVDEGDAGTTDLTFTLTLDRRSYEDVTVAYVVAGGTATAGDYGTATPASPLTIPAGATEATVTVPVTGDTEVEASETVVLRLSNLTGGAAVFGGGGTTLDATGTIRNDDFPMFSINSPEVAEGASGTTAALRFEVSLDPAATGGPSTVDWAVTGGTAASGTGAKADYERFVYRGTLTFPVGGMPQPIEFTVIGDDDGERHETVVIELSNPSAGVRIATSTGTGTIRNDDLPGLTVADPDRVVAEGGLNDQRRVVFTVRRGDIGMDEVFTYAYGVTGDSTADGGFDFATTTAEGVWGTLAFPVGSREERIEITVIGDADHEPHETVGLSITNPDNPSDEKATARVTIRNDDPNLPELTIDPVAGTAKEPPSGSSAPLRFPVRLSAASSGDVTVDWEVSGGTAEAGVDFRETSGTLPIPAGSTMEEIRITVLGDDVAEPDETVEVTLTDASGAALRRRTGTGVIEDLPALSVAGSPEVDEGISGASTTLGFEVKLSATSSGTVTFDWAVSGGTAGDGDLGDATSGTGMITTGASSTTVEVPVVGDDAFEADETVEITISNAGPGAAISADGATGIGTILDDDGDRPRLEIDSESTTATEGTELVFTVRLTMPASATLRVPYVIEGTARAGVDYEHAGTTVTIPRGVTSVPIRIALKGDPYGEPDDTVVVRLGAPTGAEVIVRDEMATAMIEDDDTAGGPTVSVRAVPPVPGEERDDGLVPFEVHVVPESSDVVTLAYAVGGGTLDPDSITYLPALTRADTPGTLRIAAGTARLGVLVRPDPGMREVSFAVRDARAAGTTIRVHPDEGTDRQAVGPTVAGAATKALGYVLAGIGRTVATNIVDLVWGRAENHRTGTGGRRATVGGRRIDTRAFADGGAGGDGDLLRAAVGLADDLLGIDTAPEALLRDAERRLARGGGLGALRDWADLPSARDLAGRTDFALSFANGEGLTPYTFWGRGSFTAFESGGLDGGTLGDFSAEGEVFAGHLGLDHRFRGDLLVGVAVSHTTGDVDYGFAADDENRGGVDTELTSLHPYLHWMSPDGLGVWGTIGYGTGSAELEGGSLTDTVETDLSMEMAAFGIRDELDRLGRIALKGDSFMAGVSADEAAGIDAVDSDVFRVRVAVEGSGAWVLPGVALLAGRFELGARLDGGDAEEGAGADLAAGFDWTVPNLGLKVKGQGSLLLAHEESGFREWGLGLGVAWGPGVAGRGFSFSLDPVWGTPASTAAAGMWNAEPGAAGGRASPRGAALDARLGYGMGVLDDRALMTVFGELGRSDGDSRLRLGAGFRPDAVGHGLALELYGERRDRVVGPDHSLVLKGRLGF